MALSLTTALAPVALAQSNNGITINNDVLNSLGPGPSPAPGAPLAPQPGYAPAPQVQAQPTLQLAPQFQEAPGSTSLQPYGGGNYVVTRPGTLLFPPLEPPTSTLAPGFSDNHAARNEAMQNAFAEGPEPSSQLLIPLDDGGAPANGAGSDSSVVVFMDNLPPADNSAAAADAPRLTLRRPPMAAPQPAPRKPEVSPEMLAEVGVTTVDEPATALAPEFQTSPGADETPAMAPTVAEVPPVAEVETTAIEPAPAAPAAATAAPEATMTEATMTEATMTDDTMTGSTMAESAMPAGGADMPAPVAMTEPAPQAPMVEAENEGPVNLLPAETREAAAADTSTNEPRPAASMTSETVASADVAAPVAPSPSTPGVQTASLTLGEPLEDMSVAFDSDSAELSDLVQAELRSLADSLRANDDGRIQVLGFASAKDGSQDLARKLALSRALKVRTFLIDAGVPSARIQVRSLGDQADGGPANRVDIRPIDS
ncbi:OmpA family protein [Pelagibius marinus]|uniref:OmpA family protein n=1 Tax=Pelagibius marinus TaxID=2762760 RepID=UPI0018722AAD|nr:OmpA family protein [Pelagibius marinus]